jgi:hypothetical protein
MCFYFFIETNTANVFDSLKTLAEVSHTGFVWILTQNFLQCDEASSKLKLKIFILKICSTDLLYFGRRHR